MIYATKSRWQNTNLTYFDYYMKALADEEQLKTVTSSITEPWGLKRYETFVTHTKSKLLVTACKNRNNNDATTSAMVADARSLDVTLTVARHVRNHRKRHANKARCKKSSPANLESQTTNGNKEPNIAYLSIFTRPYKNAANWLAAVSQANPPSIWVNVDALALCVFICNVIIKSQCY